VEILDVTDPTAPQLVSVFGVPTAARRLDVHPPYLYVADYGEGLLVVDVADPGNPTQVGSLSIPHLTEAVAVEDRGSERYAYLANPYVGVVIADVTDPANPESLVTLQMQAWDVACGDSILAVAAQIDGLVMLDVSDPAAPELLSQWNPVDHLFHFVSYQRGLAAAEVYLFGQLLADVQDPTNPSLVLVHEMGSSGDHVVVRDPYVYFTHWTGTLHLLRNDLAGGMEEVGRLELPTRVLEGVDVEGRYAYCACWDSGLVVVDVSSPDSPEIVGQFVRPGRAMAVDALGEYAYIADWEGRMWVVDVSDPTNPHQVGGYSYIPFATGFDVCVRDTLAFVAFGEADLHILDVSDPTQPHPAGFVSFPGWAYGVEVSGDYAYVAAGVGGLQVIDLSGPAPQVVGSILPGFLSRDVAVSDGLAYVATVGSSDSGVVVIDVSDPTQPQRVGYYLAPADPSGLAARGSLVYAATGGAGLQVYRCTAAPAGAGSAPRPSGEVLVRRRDAALEFLLPGPDWTVRLLDVRGRLLARSGRGTRWRWRPTGRGVYFWEAKDAGGRRTTGKLVW
jgi:hypothetical protein